MMANGAKFFQFMQTPDHPTWFWGIGVARATREEEFPRIKARIDQGFPCAVGLTQSRDIGSMGNDHQVVAYSYEDGNPNSKLMIWDNNSPGQEVVLEFKTAYDPGDREIHMGAATWRGFFLEAYAPVYPAFLQPGRLLSDRFDPAIFVVQGGGRFWIPSPAEFRKFLATIDNTVPEGLDSHVICDNYGTHKTPAIKTWLARHPWIHLYFTLTGSSWINQVERWFWFLPCQMISCGTNKSL